jgi:hypothetical protein
MSPNEQAALDQLQLAEAELAVLKQELVLQHLLDTREPTDEARALLARLREAVARLTTPGPVRLIGQPSGGNDA